MRKILFLLIVSIFIVSCESELGNFEKVKIDGKDISGWWACVGYNGDIFYDDVEEIMEIDGDALTFYESNGYPIKDGYLIGCTINDWESYGTQFVNFKNNRIYCLYYDGCIISVKGDKLYIDDEGDIEVYQKVKGFK
jgi:hypothetical protein